MPLSQGAPGQGGGIMAGADFQARMQREERKHAMKMRLQSLEAQQREQQIHKTAETMDSRITQQAHEADRAGYLSEQDRLTAQQMRGKVREWASPEAREARELERERTSAEAQYSIDAHRSKREFLGLRSEVTRSQLEREILSTQVGQELETNQAVWETATTMFPPGDKITPRKYRKFRESLERMNISPDQYGLPARGERLTDEHKTRIKEMRDRALYNLDTQREISAERRRVEDQVELSMRTHQIPLLQEQRAHLDQLIERYPDDEGLALRREEVDQALQTALHGTGQGAAPQGAVSELVQEKLHHQTFLQDIDQALELINEDWTRAGAAGRIRTIVQSGLDAATSVQDLFGENTSQWAQGFIQDTRQQIRRDIEAGRVVEEDIQSMQEMMSGFDPAIPKIGELEKTLAYRLARLNWGPGRLNVDAVQNARSSVRMTGFFEGPRTVLERLNFQRDRVHRRLHDIEFEKRELMGIPDRKTSYSPETTRREGEIVGIDEDRGMNVYRMPDGTIQYEDGTMVPLDLLPQQQVPSPQVQEQIPHMPRVP